MADKAAQQQFSALRAAPRLLDVWNEVKRILPDDAWMTELRYADGANGEKLVSVTGLSPSAAELVKLFDASPFFKNTSLSAAVTNDPIEKRERFALQTSLRSAPGEGARR